MSNLDPRWHVPASYETDLDFGGRVLRQRSQPTVPALNVLSFLALEEQLVAPGPASMLAWQLLADDDAAVVATVLRLLEDPAADRLWCAHVTQVAADPTQRGWEVAKLAWQSPATSETERVSAGLMLVTSAFAMSPDKARQFLPKIEPALVHATPGQRATYALIRAALDASPALLTEAHAQMSALEPGAQAFGLAQCALVAYQHELAGGRRLPLLRGYLEHAIYRYDLGRRESWAARVITFGLIPMIADAPADELATWLQRAAAFAIGARSLPELQGVFRAARKLGFEASVGMLEASDPPVFVRTSVPTRASQPVIPAPAVAPAAAPAAAPAPAPAPAAAPAPAKAAAPAEDKGGGKKKGKGRAR